MANDVLVDIIDSISKVIWSTLVASGENSVDLSRESISPGSSVDCKSVAVEHHNVLLNSSCRQLGVHWTWHPHLCFRVDPICAKLRNVLLGIVTGLIEKHPSCVSEVVFRPEDVNVMCVVARLQIERVHSSPNGDGGHTLPALCDVVRNVVEACKESVTINLPRELLQWHTMCISSVAWDMNCDILRCSDAGSRPLLGSSFRLAWSTTHDKQHSNLLWV